MKKVNFFIFVVVMSALAKDPMVYDFVPDSLKIMDSLLATVPSTKDTANYGDFKSIAISGGKGVVCKTDQCKDTAIVGLPAGTLMSDRKLFKYHYNEVMIENVNRRLLIAQELFSLYYKQINTANTLYNNRIDYLEKSAKRGWWEKNSIYVGFTVGIAMTIAIEAIVSRTMQTH